MAAALLAAEQLVFVLRELSRECMTRNKSSMREIPVRDFLWFSVSLECQMPPSSSPFSLWLSIYFPVTTVSTPFFELRMLFVVENSAPVLKGCVSPIVNTSCWSSLLL